MSLPVVSVRTVPGCSAQRSRTTCYAPPACSLVAGAPLPAGPRCADIWSTCRPGSLARHENLHSICPSAGRSKTIGKCSGQRHRIRTTASFLNGQPGCTDPDPETMWTRWHQFSRSSMPANGFARRHEQLSGLAAAQVINPRIQA